jgi:type IV secretion system protein VirD4
MQELSLFAKIGITLAGIVIGLLLWFFIASTVLLAAFDLDPNSATPLTIWHYYKAYQGNADVMKWVYISASASTFILGVPITLALLPEKRPLHGKAKFATRLDIKKSGLLGDSGVIVGNYNGRYMMFGGTQHVILSAPTRSGKGVGIVIPNLLSWNESLVVLDIKQENWSLTSKYRAKHGQTCYLFNPLALDGRTHRYNPLGYVSHDPNFRVDDVQKIAGMLFANTSGDNAFWEAQARMLFVGIVLFLIESKNIDENRKDTVTNFGEVLDLSLKGGDPYEFFKEALEDEKYQDLSSACKQGLLNYASNDSEKTRSSIMATFRAKFELWTNPIVTAATSSNDFDLRRIRKEKVSIYIGVSPNNLDRIAPLLNLFFQQLIDLNTGEGDLPSQNPDVKYNCLLLMDEFTAIGKMPILAKGIGYIAGYGLRMMPIIQSPSQLVEVYGKDAAITFQSNHALSIIYPPKATEIETAEAISKWLGDETVKSVSKSRSAGFSSGSGSNSTSDQRRALMLPQEIIALGNKAELVILENTPPIKAQKIIYYNDPVFTNRFKSVSDFLAQSKNKIPTKSELDKAVHSGELSAFVPCLTDTTEEKNNDGV